MPRPASSHPTEFELEILKILWDDSPLPVRDVRQSLATNGRELAHTSVITTLNIMVGKKLLKRTKQKNAFLFAPRVSRDEVSGNMLGDIIQRVFDGSTRDMMLSLLKTNDVGPDELKQIRRLINLKAKEQSE